MSKNKDKDSSLSLYENEFFEISKKYFYLLSSIYHNYMDYVDKLPSTPKKKSLFGKNKEPEKIVYNFDINDAANLNNITESYYELFSKVTSIDYCVAEYWLSFVKKYIVFLDKMDLAGLYKNSSSENALYSECDDAHSTRNLYFYDEPDDILYRISFMETDIPKNGMKSALAYYLDSEEDDKNLTLVQIDIMRMYGDKVSNQIKMIERDPGSGDWTSSAKHDEALVFNVLRTRLSNVMKETFDRILINIGRSITNNRTIFDEPFKGYIEIPNMPK